MDSFDKQPEAYRDFKDCDRNAALINSKALEWSRTLEQILKTS